MYSDDCLDFSPDIDLVAAAQAGFLDGAAGLFVAAVAAKAQCFLTGSRYYILPIYWNRAVYAFACFLYGLQVYADLRYGVFHTA